MNSFLDNLTIINNTDTRQQGKIKYKLNTIVALSLFATIGNTNSFTEIQNFTEEHQTTLQKIIPNLKKAPSHDNLYHTFTMIEKEYFNNL